MTALSSVDLFRGLPQEMRQELSEQLTYMPFAAGEAVTREGNDAGITAQRAAARQIGARDRLARLEAALAELPDVIAVKKKSGAKDKEPRVSTTDAEARVMKMPDGGFRPAFNVQLATTTDKARVIVGMAVSNRGSDA